MKTVLKSKFNTCMVCNTIGINSNIDISDFIRSIKTNKLFNTVKLQSQTRRGE